MEGLPLARKPTYNKIHFEFFQNAALYQGELIRWIESIQGSESGLQDQIDANASGVASNTLLIQNNVTDIQTNSDAIETNANSIVGFNINFDDIKSGSFWDGESVVTTGSFEFGKIIAGNPGFEGSGITIHGVTYESSAKVSDLDGTNLAQFILHRHSTTTPPVIVAARSNTDDETHAIVTDGQILFALFASGHDGADYELAASISFEVDGTPGNNDMPGRIVFSTTPDGAFIPVFAGKFDSSQFFKLANDLEVTEGGTGASTASGARTNLDVDQAGTDNSTNVTFAGTPNYITIVGQVITRALINLTSHITGILPLANGGTNDAAVTPANIGHLKAMNQDVGTGDSPTHSNLTITSSASIDGRVNITGPTGFLAATVNGTARFHGGTTTGYQLYGKGSTWDVTIGSGNGATAFTVYTGSANSRLWGDVDVSGKITGNDTTDSTSTTTGSIQTDGGFAAVKNIIGGQLVKCGSGATGSRPTPRGAGSMWFDTTLGIPIWHDGTNWIDATGTTV